MEHTPTPWRVLEVMGQKFVASEPTEDHPYFNRTKSVEILSDEEYPRRDADVAFIVRACNAHEELVTLVRQYKALCGNTGYTICRETANDLWVRASALLPRLGAEE